MTEETLAIALPTGEAHVSLSIAPATSPIATMVFGHGAGAGREHPFLTGFAAALADAGVTTILFNFPYAEAGRRMPGPASHAVATWRALRSRVAEIATTPLWLGGKSYGGRMASVAVAEGLNAAGLVYLGYPLHPPGQPEKERGGHLARIAVPQLFVEGTKDPFIIPHDRFASVVGTCQDATVHWVDGGGHSFEVAGLKRTPDEVGRSLATPVSAFVRSR